MKPNIESNHPGDCCEAKNFAPEMIVMTIWFGNVVHLL